MKNNTWVYKKRKRKEKGNNGIHLKHDHTNKQLLLQDMQISSKLELNASIHVYWQFCKWVIFLPPDPLIKSKLQSISFCQSIKLFHCGEPKQFISSDVLHCTTQHIIRPIALKFVKNKSKKNSPITYSFVRHVIHTG